MTKERQKIIDRDKRNFEDWHEGRMKEINKPSSVPGTKGGCVLLLAIPTVAIGLVTAAKIYFG